jgi:hypothetical protein
MQIGAGLSKYSIHFEDGEPCDSTLDISAPGNLEKSLNDLMACAMVWSAKAKHHSDWEYELATALPRHVCFLQHTKDMQKHEGASMIGTEG